MHEYSDMEGKVAIVTGSTSGIGLETARVLLEHGMRVVTHGRASTAPPTILSLASQHEHLEYVGADLRDPEAAATLLVDAALARWHRLDLVVNNAAQILHQDMGLTTADDWASVLNVNVVAPFSLAQAARTALAASSGSIVMISSTNAIRVWPDNTVYDVSKAALNHLALSLCVQLRPDGIRVNTLMPGGVVTPSLTAWARAYAGSEDKGLAVIEEGVADGTVAAPRTIAEGVLLLSSPAAQWINGATISIDGGHHLGV